MVPRSSAETYAAAQVEAVRDAPAARLALVDRTYHDPSGLAPRHLPYRRAAMSFIRWQLRRGVLEPPAGANPGSPWWRAINERLLRDGCEAVALSGLHSGQPSSPAVGHWLAFIQQPTARSWYRAHNATVVSAYLENRDLATPETAAERFFMNLVLCRVLYAHALVAAPRMALSWLAPIAPALGDPRLGMAGIFLSLSRVLPAAYPLTEDVDFYLSDELSFGRLLDFGVIFPRLQQLYEWSATELMTPDLRGCVTDGVMTYAWSVEEAAALRMRTSFAIRAVRRLMPPAGIEPASRA